VVVAPIGREPLALASAPARVAPAAARSESGATKKDDVDDAESDAPILATLVQTHTDERLILDRDAPTQERFTLLLADRTTASSRMLDPRLLDLLRAVAKHYQALSGGTPPRIELVSGYRSAKLNELLRKKGHHVASHSQHSLGHAVDFRVVPEGASKAIDPREVEKEIRKLGWDGGVGTYPTAADWFVHADVGPNRHWVN
jgi:uncharacterized protein YcbK (DUF882 family)